MNPSQSKNPWIASLCSFVLHLVILLLMAIWSIATNGKEGRLSIDSGIVSDSSESINVLDVANSDEEPSDMGDGPDTLTSSILASDLPPTPTMVNQPGLAPISSLTNLPSDAIRTSGDSGKSTSAFIGTSLELRSPKNRSQAGALNGATRQSEAAVEAALAYLARHQRNNGSWTVHFEDSPCKGECSNGGSTKDPHEIAATGLALLCFLGAGHTMHSGEYSEVVNKGVYYLLQSLKISSASGSWLDTSHKSEMYEHGIATLALTEALHMTGEESLKESCQAAITFIIDAQFSDGGWGYHPRTP
ncbi:MAG: prenyltransferase/squalene oxidase repeat-containing protein, partial [Pirellula sp.]